MLYQKRCDLATVDDDYFTPTPLTGAGPFAIAAAIQRAPDRLAHQLSITTTTDESLITATITGTNSDGEAQTEAITMPNNTTVESTKYFLTVTAITLSATVGTDTFDVGYVDEVMSETLFLNWRGNAPARVYYTESGTLEVDIEQTLADRGRYASQFDMPWNLAIVTGLDDIQNGEYFEVPAGVVALRAKVNSYSTNAEFTLYVSQPEQLAV
jgi:hypothetical protein